MNYVATDAYREHHGLTFMMQIDLTPFIQSFCFLVCHNAHLNTPPHQPSLNGRIHYQITLWLQRTDVSPSEITCFDEYPKQIVAVVHDNLCHYATLVISTLAHMISVYDGLDKHKLGETNRSYAEVCQFDPSVAKVVNEI